jgi:thiol-disulfide isomerase/thioredoxin
VTRSRLLSILVGLAIGAIAVAGFVVFRGSGDSVTHIDLQAAEVGDLPGTAVLRLDGTTTTLGAFAGKPMVINFWQQSCAPCRREMPAFEQVHQSVRDKVTFIGVNGGDELDVVNSFVKQVQVTYQILRDPRYELAAAMKVSVYPATFVVSPTGNILKAQYGEMNVAELTKLIGSQTT